MFRLKLNHQLIFIFIILFNSIYWKAQATLEDHPELFRYLGEEYSGLAIRRDPDGQFHLVIRQPFQNFSSETVKTEYVDVYYLYPGTVVGEKVVQHDHYGKRILVFTIMKKKSFSDLSHSTNTHDSSAAGFYQAINQSHLGFSQVRSCIGPSYCETFILSGMTGVHRFDFLNKRSEQSINLSELMDRLEEMGLLQNENGARIPQRLISGILFKFNTSGFYDPYRTLAFFKFEDIRLGTTKTLVGDMRSIMLLRPQTPSKYQADQSSCYGIF